jgi:hypothetical protein
MTGRFNGKMTNTLALRLPYAEDYLAKIETAAFTTPASFGYIYNLCIECMCKYGCFRSREFL